ncbi:MAG: hypothetical protein OEY79_04305 [Anaplasmataceae bacterium]|nr:hypothetical protein [Anaplasmataceae bacterium]
MKYSQYFDELLQMMSLSIQRQFFHSMALAAALGLEDFMNLKYYNTGLMISKNGIASIVSLDVDIGIIGGWPYCARSSFDKNNSGGACLYKF